MAVQLKKTWLRVAKTDDSPPAGDMNGDYSSTPAYFRIAAEAGRVAYLHRLVMRVSSAEIWTDGFGGKAKLPVGDGIEIKIKKKASPTAAYDPDNDEVIHDISEDQPIRRNTTFLRWGTGSADIYYQNNWADADASPPAIEQFFASVDMKCVFGFIPTINGDQGEYLECKCQGDQTGPVGFSIQATGHYYETGS